MPRSDGGAVTKPVVLLSSGGKDSLSALRALRQDPAWRVEALLTTFNEDAGRVAMHGTRRELMRAQAEALGLPQIEVGLPEQCSNEIYETRLAEALRPLPLQHAAFGDLFLTDIRDYRIRQMKELELEAVFPIWGRDTRALAASLIDEGWDIILNCVDAEQLDPAFLGRRLDKDLLRDLPEGVDPCGENGEFHTFVSYSPDFSRPVPVTAGEHVIRGDRFHFLDLLPS